MPPEGVLGQSSSVLHVGTQTMSSRGLSWQMQPIEVGGQASTQSSSVLHGVRSGRSPSPGPVRVSSVSDGLVEVVVAVVPVEVVPVGVVGVVVAEVVVADAVGVVALESPESLDLEEQALIVSRRVSARKVKLRFMGLLGSV